MKTYIYNADVYCEDCGRELRRRIAKEGSRPANPRDEYSYDSGDYPKGPYDGEDNTSDTPQHCGNGDDCLDPLVIDGEKYGKFLENPLTVDGEQYVRDQHDGKVLAAMWMKFYELE